MKRLLVILLILTSIGLSAQQIVEAEYYFDIDPGYGSGTPISITANQDVSDLSVTVDVSGISDGIHNLNVRAKDDNGSWSLTHKQIILKSQLPSPSSIEELEYFYDSDPGEGNGIPISITPNVDIENHISTISTSGISEGVHILGIRSKSDEGIWTHVILKPIYVTALPITKDIIELEYFVGADPGLGGGTPISISQIDDLPDYSLAIPIGDLSLGVNKLSIRAIDSDGQWSHCSINSILKLKVPNVPDIEELEYFFDTDPGFGNGTFVSYSPSPNWEDISVLISTNSLADGIHILYIRSRDSNGVWSFANSTIIQKTTIEEISDITKMEYFFDVDPGLGSGTQISITPDVEINNYVVSISTTGLSKGIHTFFVRSKNENGEWSLSHSKSILITNPKTVEDITAMEYYFDADSGYGMGSVISFTDMPDIVDLNSIVTVAGLSTGVHHLHVRSKDNKGKWSQNIKQSFFYRSPDVEENIQKIEYYVGDDPGFGNGVDVTLPGITASSDIVDLQNLIDISSLDAGVQRISIRSQNDLGVWSFTHVIPIYVYKNLPSNMVKAEYFIDTDPGYGLATEVSFAPMLDKSDHIIPLDVSSLDFGVHRLHTRYMSENGKWTLDEITPFYFKDGELYALMEGEYFIDIDPELGLGTSFTFPLSTDIPDISVLILTDGLDPGEHDLYIRTKNTKGEWSLTNVKFDIEIESALPLSILSFEVRKKDREALLEWVVNDAVNTSHFEIERAKRTEFSNIGRVESINKLTEKEYNFIDSKPYEGWNYYRLKQVDLDGDFQYSYIRSVNFETENSIIVYPNPSINEIRVDGNIAPNTKYLIYDSNNKLVKEGDLYDNTSIEVNDLISGAYHFILRNGDENHSFLIIKI